MVSDVSAATTLIIRELNRNRFDDATLRILEGVLAARDVASLLQVRSSVREVLLSHALVALSAAGEGGTVGEKLSTADFFASAFALVGDAESCLSVKYEVLVLRESKYSNDPDLKVSQEEWLNFAKNSLDNGFYSIAAKALEKAHSCIYPNYCCRKESDPTLNMVPESVLKELQSLAHSMIPWHSVQAQSAEYLKRKDERVRKERSSLCVEKPRPRPHVGSWMFKMGIKRRNIRNLQCSQDRQQ